MHAANATAVTSADTAAPAPASADVAVGECAYCPTPVAEVPKKPRWKKISKARQQRDAGSMVDKGVGWVVVLHGGHIFICFVVLVLSQNA